MSCFFCESFTHVSQFCDIYVSDESRKNRALSKNCCENCLTDFHTINKDIHVWKCEIYQKCYLCFSKNHHTAFCPDRFTGPNIFVPCIDDDLLPRFVKVFNSNDLIEEKYLLAISLPNLSRLINLEKITVVDNSHMNSPKRFPNEKIMLKDDLSLDHIHSHKGLGVTCYFQSIIKIIIRSTSVILNNSRISPHNFLHLLSSNTKFLRCTKFKFTTKCYLRDILKKAIKIEEIVLHDTNIESGKIWPNDLLRFANRDTFKKLELTIKVRDFNVRSLAGFMKSLSKNNAQILLHYSSNGDCNTASELFIAKLSKYFVLKNSDNYDTPRLYIYIAQTNTPGIKCVNFYLKKEDELNKERC